MNEGAIAPPALRTPGGGVPGKGEDTCIDGTERNRVERAAAAIRKAAAEYVAAGFALVPLDPNSKGTEVKCWNRRENAITRADQLQRIAGNIGVALAWSRFWTLDLDALARARDWLAGHGFDVDALLAAPDAVRISSGIDNKAKLVYRLPDGVAPFAYWKLIENGEAIVEFRCGTAGGLTVQDVLPPSIHPETGKPYRWEYNAPGASWRAIPHAPEALLNFAIAGKPRAPEAPPTASSPSIVSDISEDELRAMLDCLTGSEYVDNYDIWIGWGQAIHRWDPGPRGFALWDEWSQHGVTYGNADTQAAKRWKGFGKPTANPLTIASIAQAAYRAGYGRVARIEDFDDLGPVDATGTPADPPDLDCAEFSVARFLDRKPPAQRFLVPGIVPAGKVGVIYGAGGTSKSMLAVMLGLQVATAQDVLDVPGWVPRDRGRVLILDAEQDEDDIHRRFAAIFDQILADDVFGHARAIEPEIRAALQDHRFVHVPAGGMAIKLADERSRRSGADWLCRQVTATRADLVVIDPVASFREGPEDNLQPLVDVGREINAKTGAAVLYVHHVSKASRGTEQAREAGAARGDSKLIDGARFGIGIAPMSLQEAKNHGVLVDAEIRQFVGVRLAKSNVSAESAVVWFRRGPSGVLSHHRFPTQPEQETAAQEDRQAAALQVMADAQAHDRRLSKTDAIALLGERAGLSRTKARGVIEDLLARGQLRVKHCSDGDPDARRLNHGYLVVTGGTP
ncbi:MAG: AAA family ATPase [Bradyrhizobium sp.]|uniref:AAA family ATPase n=1 Tax=Bradyrhizobium sp. TaxID=376 RepID=UPI003D0A8CB5